MQLSAVVAFCALVAGASAKMGCSGESKWGRYTKTNGQAIQNAINAGGSPFTIGSRDAWTYTAGNAQVCIVNKGNKAAQSINKNAVSGGMTYILNECCSTDGVCQAGWAEISSDSRDLNYVTIISASDNCKTYSGV